VISEPYPGPRPYNKREARIFFGRDEEIGDIRDLVMAYQVVVLYSQSGAGKSSLVRAGLHPALVRERVRFLSARVAGNTSHHFGDRQGNIYVENALSSLFPLDAELDQDLGHNLAVKLHRAEYRHPVVVVFDQFEELFTAHPDRWRDRDGFFSQLRDSLKDDAELRVILVIREEHLAELDAYSEIVPLHFRIRYRLERLKEDAAMAAIQEPARLFDFSVEDQQARKLIANLRQIKVRAGKSIREVEGEYVEPVHLQVVCHDVWRKRDQSLRTLTIPDKVEDIDHALASYYDAATKRAATEGRLSEAKIRSWFERELITPAGTRGFVFKGEQRTAGLANRAIELLEQEHVIRSEPRGADSWYELTHDRLIAPIKRSNNLWWRKRRLHRWPAYAVLVILAGTVAFFAFRSIMAERYRSKAADAILKGDGQASRKHWKESLQFYNQALMFYKKAHDRSRHAELYSSIGSAYLHTYDYDQAQRAFEAALKESAADSDPDLLVQLGRVLFKNGRTDEAAYKYQEALDWFNRAKEAERDDEKEAETLRDLAEAQLRTGDFKAAKESYFRAIAHITRFEQSREIVDDIFGIGLVYSQRGDYSKGLAFYRVLMFQIPTPLIARIRLPARLLREAGFDELHLKKWGPALKDLDKAYIEARSLNDPEQQAYAALALAEYHLEHAETNQARQGKERERDNAEEPIKCDEPKRVTNQYDMQELGRGLESAKEAAEKFLQINDKVMHGAALTYEARFGIVQAVADKTQGKAAQSVGEFQDAREKLKEAYESQRQSNRKIGQAYALQAMGLLYEAQARRKDAAERYKEAYCVYDSMNSKSIHRCEVEMNMRSLGEWPVDCPKN